MPNEPVTLPETPSEKAVSQEGLKSVIAANLADLRKSRSMTQQELAERLNYTDKAISKWERGESLPDVLVLKKISDIFGVSVDYLLTADHPHVPVETSAPVEDSKHQQRIRTRGFVTGMSVLLVWMAAVVMFIVFETVSANPLFHWGVFSCAVCASLIIWLVMNSIWFNRRRNYLIISLLMWSCLILLYITVYFTADRMLWLIFLLGIPGQAIIIMWSRLNQDGD